MYNFLFNKKENIKFLLRSRSRTFSQLWKYVSNIVIHKLKPIPLS